MKFPECVSFNVLMKVLYATHRLLAFFADDTIEVPHGVPEESSVPHRPSMKVPRIFQANTKSCIDEASEAFHLTFAFDMLIDWLEQVSYTSHID